VTITTVKHCAHWRVSSSGIWRRVIRRVVPDVLEQITRRHIPEDDTLQNHRCENLKSYTVHLSTFDLLDTYTTRDYTSQITITHGPVFKKEFIILVLHYLTPYPSISRKLHIILINSNMNWERFLWETLFILLKSILIGIVNWILVFPSNYSLYFSLHL
jgi:hypothetical protein